MDTLCCHSIRCSQRNPGHFDATARRIYEQRGRIWLARPFQEGVEGYLAENGASNFE